MSSPISSNMGPTVRSPELCRFELASRKKKADAGQLRVGYFVVSRLDNKRRGQ
jgi:hypothetical protein